MHSQIGKQSRRTKKYLLSRRLFATESSLFYFEISVLFPSTFKAICSATLFESVSCFEHSSFLFCLSRFPVDPACSNFARIYCISPDLERGVARNVRVHDGNATCLPDVIALPDGQLQ